MRLAIARATGDGSHEQSDVRVGTSLPTGIGVAGGGRTR